VVPIHFVFHEGGVYSFSMMGAKIENMRLNPHVCLQVDEVKNTSTWTSVILHGLYQELEDNEQWQSERIYAWSLIQKHPNWWEPGGSTIHPHETGIDSTKPIFFSIQKESLTGRKAVQREDFVR
jgi:nitroimidazol reductase NimA-like FMN-containing flavoprotein (pyridoxamine 5'-phosphate oxidase superfamily)